jgi:hypothetical protein
MEIPGMFYIKRKSFGSTLVKTKQIHTELAYEEFHIVSNNMIKNATSEDNNSVLGYENILLKNDLAMGVGMIILIENIFTFIVLLRCQKILLQIRILSITLCTTDLLAGLSFSVPDFFLEEYFQCRMKKYPQTFLATMSVLTVSMINADRCLAFYYGINYYIRVTPKRVKIAVVCMWIFCIANGYLTYFDREYSYGICCTTMEFTPNNSMNFIGKSTNVIILFSNIFFYCYIVSSIKSREQKAVVCKLTVITGCVLGSCGPGLLVFLLFPMNKVENRKYFLYTGMFVLLNSVVNPFLYVWRFSEARYQCKRIICFWNQKLLQQEDSERKQTYATYRINVTSANFCQTSLAENEKKSGQLTLSCMPPTV